MTRSIKVSALKVIFRLVVFIKLALIKKLYISNFISKFSNTNLNSLMKTLDAYGIVVVSLL